MVADHERSTRPEQPHLAGREGNWIDRVVNDVTGQGAIKGSQIVQGSVKEAQVMKLGSLHGSQRRRARSIISRDRSTPTTRYLAASRAALTRPGPQPASRILPPGQTRRILPDAQAAGSLWTGALRTGVPARRRPWRGPGHDRCSSVRIGCVTTPWRRPLRGIGRTVCRPPSSRARACRRGAHRGK